MIRYALVCERKHDFEIWFNDSADYDKQRKRGLVTCPALRFEEGREGDHGAGDLRRAQAKRKASPRPDGRSRLPAPRTARPSR